MRRTAICLLPTIAASLTLAACGGSSYSAGSSSKSNAASTAPSSPSSPATSSAGAAGVVKTAANSKLGATVLTTTGGMTLYRLSGERAGRFICAKAPCTQLWHPLTASATSAPSGAGSLGTVKRPDGSEQVTYKGMPLYTFAEDRRPGDAKGQGFKDVGTWNAVTVGGGSQAAGAPAAAPQTAPAESGGGYHY